MEERSLKFVWRLRCARGLFVLSAFAYFACLFLPAYVTYFGSSFGLEALFIGPLGVVGGHLSWFANPLLWIAWAKGVPEDRFLSILCASGALVLALTFLAYKEVPVGDAGTHTYKIAIGYLAWLSSIAIAMLSAIVLPKVDNTPQAMPNTSLERTREG